MSSLPDQPSSDAAPPPTLALPAELAWLNGLTFRFGCTTETDENGVVSRYYLRFSGSSPNNPNTLNGMVEIPSAKLLLSADQMRLVAHHVITMMTHGLDAFRSDYMSNLPPTPPPSGSRLIRL